MGSCVSLHKTLDSSDPKPHRWLGSETANTISIQTPTNDQDQDDVNDHQHSTTQFLSEANAATFPDQSNKGDVFFDSQACLDSDCEDFLSVNGDFTPSRGNNPIHQSSFIEVQLDSNVLGINRSPDSTTQNSPRDVQKRLGEFLHENLLKVEQVNGSPNISVSNSVSPWETTSSRVLKQDSGRLTRSISCCLPSLPRTLSFGEWKKGSAQTKPSYLLQVRKAFSFKKPVL